MEVENKEASRLVQTRTEANRGNASPEEVAFIAAEMAKRIIQSGGEIYRAEDTAARICRAYGADNVDVAVILSVLVLTVDIDGATVNISRHVKDVCSNNLGRLARLNDLSRRICRTLPPKSDFLAELEELERKSCVKITRKLAGGVLTAIGFAVFFGGGVIDALLSGLISIPMTLLGIYLDKLKMNAIIAKFIVCFIGGVLAMMAVRVGIQCNPDKIIIGDIMPVVAGVLLANSFRDLLSGDIMSGFFRLCTAVLDAVAIACGYAVAILMLGGAI